MNMGKYDFLKTGLSQQEQISGKPVGTADMPRYGTASRMGLAGGSSEWVNLQLGSHCSVCGKPFLPSVAHRVQGHSWCADCNNSFERLTL